MKKDRIEFSFIYQDKDCLKMYFAKANDGVLFGVSDNELGDVHLTILYKDEKLGYHITDKTIDKPYQMDSHFYPEILMNKIQKILKKIIIPYHGNKKAFVMKGKLKTKFNSYMGEMEKKPNEIDRAIEEYQNM